MEVSLVEESVSRIGQKRMIDRVRKMTAWVFLDLSAVEHVSRFPCLFAIIQKCYNHA